MLASLSKRRICLDTSDCYFSRIFDGNMAPALMKCAKLSNVTSLASAMAASHAWHLLIVVARTATAYIIKLDADP